MIIVRIVGGLASQLHKYAVGRALALRLGVELRLDLDWFDHPPITDTVWSYQLDRFCLAANVASPQEVRRVRGHPWWNRFVRRVNNQFGKKILGSREVDLSTLSIDQWSQLSDNLYLHGEAAGDGWFRNIRALLLQEFQLRTTLSSLADSYAAQIQAAEFPVSLHIRRGDFISNPTAARFHALTDLEYFRAAVSAVLQRHQYAQFFVFSDDPSWVRINFLSELPWSSVMVEALENVEDFVLMSRCRGNIICNSGFSWTAAWLNDAPDRMVVSPKRWLKDDQLNLMVIQAMYQPDWFYL